MNDFPLQEMTKKKLEKELDYIERKISCLQKRRDEIFLIIGTRKSEYERVAEAIKRANQFVAKNAGPAH